MISIWSGLDIGMCYFFLPACLPVLVVETVCFVVMDTNFKTQLLQAFIVNKRSVLLHRPLDFQYYSGPLN